VDACGLHVLGAPYDRCPKCGAMPLADEDEKSLCERCNQWYNVVSGEQL
jgi:ribosomal protein S27AE